MRSLFIAFLACQTLAFPVIADSLKIVTDIPPVHSLVTKVAGQHATADLLLSGQDDAHHFQMRPSQVRILANADLVIWVGEDLTPWLDSALHSNAPDVRQIELLSISAPDVEKHDEHGEGHDDHDEDHVEHDDHDRTDDHRHATDPHVWLDPKVAMHWLPEIAAILSELDPQHADEFKANATTAAAEISALNEEIGDQLASSNTIPAATLHDAYGHFESSFGIEIAGHLRDSDATAPSAARVAELQALAQSGALRCIYTEPLHHAGALQTVADQTGLEIHELDPLGTTLQTGPDLYVELLGNLADGILACAG